MSHVFISYNHIDTTHLNTLVYYLTENNISIWYDAHLEGGDDWRDEISIAIDESFAMLIIVTQNMLNSHYCTYEWSYGMGTGIPVIPLIFEDVNITEIHAPLRNKQFVNCITHIPDLVVHRLQNFREEPIDEIYLRRKIMEAIMPFRIYMHTLIWYRELRLSVSQKRHTSQDLGMLTRDTAAKLYYDVLPELITIRSHAFTIKLRRATRTLTEALHEIYDALQIAVFDNHMQPGEQDRLFQEIGTGFMANLEPIIKLAADHSPLFFKYLDYLHEASDHRPDPFHKMDVRILFGLYLDDKEQERLLDIIDSAIDYLHSR